MTPPLKTKAVIITDLLPGAVRIVVQLYHPSTRSYCQPPGHALAGIRVQNGRELKRLWQAVQDVIDAGQWRDVVHRLAKDPATYIEHELHEGERR